MPVEQEIAEAMQRVGMRHLQFDADRRALKFAVPGIEINLGSIGKGYALDRAAEVLAAAGVNDFLLHGGNSSVLARGNSQNPLSSGEGVSEPQASDGWWIGLRHPLQARRRIGEIRLRDRAIGTSGSGTQFFVHEGRRYGHILDPRTGWPASGTLSTTVVAPTGTQADALATAFYVMGRDAATDFCRRHGEISAVIMSPIPGSARAELALINFSDGDIRLTDDESIAVR
jgi:thiamine biosynthesis lipoprotein